MNNFREFQCVKCNELTKVYGTGTGKNAAVSSVNLELSSGKTYALIGRSGSGKSTLVKMLSGIIKPTSGGVYYDDLNINSLSEREKTLLHRYSTGIVYQDFRLLGELNAVENISLPAILGNDQVDSDWLNDILQFLEIESLKYRFPHEMSGGEQQRVAIARALINRPRFIFADEPTGNLDKSSSDSVVELFEKIKFSYNTMILLATHDMEIAEKMDYRLRIEDGKLVEY